MIFPFLCIRFVIVEKEYGEIQFHEKSALQNKLFSFLCQITRTNKIGMKLLVLVSRIQKINNGNIKIFTATKLSFKIPYNFLKYSGAEVKTR